VNSVSDGTEFTLITEPIGPTVGLHHPRDKFGLRESHTTYTLQDASPPIKRHYVFAVKSFIYVYYKELDFTT
jgi:hypothetical protein